MFQSARIKLTLWYLVILVIISGCFSVVIYKGLSMEVDRFARAQRSRIERQYRMNVLFLPDSTFGPVPVPLPAIDDEALSEVRHRIVMQLLLINGAIILLAGALSYVLAGITLDPIQNMVREQHRFISDASHEFRTPLTALKSSMEVHLRDKKLTITDAKKLISGSINEVNKLQALSDSLLELTQYQQPNHIPFTVLEMKEVATQAIAQVQPLATAKDIRIASSLKPCTVKGNRYSLHDLVVILLDNAIKYSDSGKTIHVMLAGTGSTVTLSVVDSGIGISTTDLPHIFDRFYRADVARSGTERKGYGLGLSIAKQIVDAHHGTIGVTSIPRKGTTFTVNLQRASVD